MEYTTCRRPYMPTQYREKSDFSRFEISMDLSKFVKVPGSKVYERTYNSGSQLYERVVYSGKIIPTYTSPLNFDEI